MKITICGAGIAGIATAYFIKEILPKAELILIDKNQPLSFTSSVSGENFRDYWPHPCMQQLSSRSIDLMENLKRKYDPTSFTMKSTGYHFISFEKHKSIFLDDTNPEFYAPYFHLNRNKNKAIQKEIELLSGDGQL